MNPLQQIQEDVTAQLMGNPATLVVPFTSYRKEIIASVATESQAAWAQRDGVDPATIGVACLILMPKGKVVDPNVPGPQLEMELIVRTFEDPKINTTGLSSEDVALANLSWLDGLVINVAVQLYGGEDALRPNYQYPGFLTYDTILRAPMPQAYIGRTMAPSFANDPTTGLVTLSCGDPAAAIFYAVGTASIQPGLQSQLYSAPFAVPVGTTVRAIAYNPLYMPSNIVTAIMTVTGS